MRLLALFLLLPALALAQTNAIIRPLVGSRGVTLPPDSTALVDEATALSLNPGSLRFVGGPQLIFLHERNRLQDQVGNGLFTGTTLAGVVGFGFGLEWLRNQHRAGLPPHLVGPVAGHGHAGARSHLPPVRLGG